MDPLRAFARKVKKTIRRALARPRSQETVSSQGLILDPCFVDEYRKLSVGHEAAMQLQSKNDTRYTQEGQGVIEVDMARWEEAQRYERRAWMKGRGLRARSDRNSEHERGFENYAAIQRRYFDNAIEIGCGPFTNMVRILKYVRCESVTLLDPLIDDYLTHPNCTYKRKRLGGWFGKKVQTVALPVENFATDQVYDLVVVVNVLEHCFSTPRFFERIISLTAPNGVLVFHDKLIPASVVQVFVENIYDAGHPLRVVEDRVLGFLSENYVELYRKRVSIPSPIGAFDSIYFVGQKREVW